MRGVAADSVIIGLLAFRILRGQLLRRFSDSILISLLSFSILAGWSDQSTGVLGTNKTTHYSGAEFDHP
jgi:hypothetical protein